MYRVILIGVLLLAYSSCQEKEIGPVGTADGAPVAVTNLQIENLPGGAKITYALPDDYQFAYVKAEYLLKNGTVRVTTSSQFKNFVMIEGLVDTTVQEVQLYSVNRNEKSSAPVTVQIRPKEAPVNTVLKTLEVKEDFGGIHYKLVNSAESELVVYTLKKNKAGNWEQIDRLYTKAPEREYSIRGQESQATDFAIYIKDAWENRSDTLRTRLTPLYEELVDKKSWKHYPLPNDSYKPWAVDHPITNLWDNSLALCCYWVALRPAERPLPSWFTIDVGAPWLFSRIKVNQYTVQNYAYTNGNPRRFEIWGSNNPAPDGSWDSWTLLLSGESIKPSGLGIGQTTAEDQAYAAAGEDYTFPAGIPKMRYIRFKTVESWGRVDNPLIAELTLWGQK